MIKSHPLKEKFILFVLAVFYMFAVFSEPVFAEPSYSSWIRGTSEYEHAAKNLTGIEYGEDNLDGFARDTDPHTDEKMGAKIIVDIGTSITDGLKGGGIDASTTGIIMGKVVNGVNYFVFDLTDQNIFGLIGAYLYVAFRNISMSFILIFVIWKIISGAFSEKQGFGALKSSLMTLVVILVLLFAMPGIVDWMCEARDFMTVKLFKALDSVISSDPSTNLASTISLEKEYYDNYTSNRTYVNALIYLGISILPLFYLLSYLRIAITLVVLFGMFPMFAILSAREPKQISSWCALVFSNIFVPMIDLMLIMLPALALNLIEAAVEGGIRASVLKAMIIMSMFIYVIPSRNMILGLLGNHMGVPGGLGLLGAAAAVAGAAKGAFGAAKDAISGGGKHDGGSGGDESDDAQKSDSDASDTESPKGLDATKSDLGEISPSGDKEDNQDNDQNGNNDGPAELNDINSLEGNELNMPGANDDDEQGELNDGETGDGEGKLSEGNMPASDDIQDIPPSDDSGEDNGGGGGTFETVDNGGGEGSSPDIVNAEGDNVNVESGGDNVPAGDADLPDRGLTGKEDNYVNVEGTGEGGGGSEGSTESFTEPNDIPPDPMAGMTADASVQNELQGSNSSEKAVADAEQMIKDSTVTGKDLENQASNANASEHSLGKVVAANSQPSVGDNKNLERELNMSRAANLQTMDNLRQKSESLDKDNAAAQASIASNNNLLSRNSAKLNDLNTKEQDILKKYDPATNLNARYTPSGSTPSGEDAEALKNIRNERAQIENSSKTATNNISAAQERIASNNVAKQHISNEIDRRTSTEQNFANIQSSRGMNSKTYSSAKEFTHQLEHDTNVRKTANYKNFTNEKYRGALTPQEREQFQRQQDIRHAVGKGARIAGQIAGGAALTAVGAGAAVVLAVGGGAEGAQLGAKIMGHGMGKVGAGASEAAKSTGKFLAKNVPPAYDKYNKEWSAKQEKILHPEQKEKKTRKELAAEKDGRPDIVMKDVKPSSNNPVPNTEPPKSGPGQGSGKTAADIFERERNSGGSKTIDERERIARENAQRTADRYRNGGV